MASRTDEHGDLLQRSDAPGAPPPWAEPEVARRMQTLLGRLTVVVAVFAFALIAAATSGASLPAAAPVIALARAEGLGSALLGLLPPALLGLVAALLLSAARAAADPAPIRDLAPGYARRVGPAARVPQALAVGGLGLAALIATFWLQGPHDPATPPLDIVGAIGGVLIALAFPLLVAERVLSTVRTLLLPEAAELAALLRVAVLGWPACGVLMIATGFGIDTARYGIDVLAAAGALVTAELVLRALARLFLPPPDDTAARAACRSLLANLLPGGRRGGGLLATVRESLGIDFARSWALAFLRGALPPVVLGLAVLVWAMTGVIIVGSDQRAIVERFGQPVAVLQPGLHLVWPAPASRLRWLDHGVTHETDLAGDGAAATSVRRARADDRGVPEADRLWTEAHPTERLFLIASASGSQQGFQAMDADIRLIWRVGMDDAAAGRFVYGAANPDRLLASIAGRVLAGAFAGETLEALLGESRAALAARLASAIQAEVDRAGLGIAIASVVIEALHPPIGAAQAFQGVQAAEIEAQAAVAAARREDVVARAQAAQLATETAASAVATAAETKAAAAATLTAFDADQRAAQTGGASFRLERYLDDVVPALSRAALTVIDHRVEQAQAPTIDLRPPGSAGVPGKGGPE